jgi:hypothetical protein
MPLDLGFCGTIMLVAMRRHPPTTVRPGDGFKVLEDAYEVARDRLGKTATDEAVTFLRQLEVIVGPWNSRGSMLRFLDPERGELVALDRNPLRIDILPRRR